MNSGNDSRKNAFAGRISSNLQFPAASIFTCIQYLDAELISSDRVGQYSEKAKD
jgi:hypothetical protein